MTTACSGSAVCVLFGYKDPKDYVFENVNDQWMGASLSSQYNASDGYFLVCKIKCIYVSFSSLFLAT